MKTLLPHAAPYAVYVALGAAGTYLAPYSDAVRYVDALRILIVGAMLLGWMRRGAYPELGARPGIAGTLYGLAAGLAVGIAWVPLAKLVPAIGETARTGLDPDAGVTLTVLRIVDMVLIVPRAEELIMRSAVPRFVDARHDQDWRALPIGVFTRTSVVVSVAFFTLTHPEWLAALATGLLWTALLAKTRNLRSVVLAHAVANAWLAGHVLVTHETQWW